jgi:hypothetical protein
VAVRGHGGVLGWGERKREEKERGEKKRERGEKKRELNVERTVLFVFVRCAPRRKNIFAMVLFVLFSRRGAVCFIIVVLVLLRFCFCVVLGLLLSGFEAPLLLFLETKRGMEYTKHLLPVTVVFYYGSTSSSSSCCRRSL